MELKVEYDSYHLLNDLWSGARKNAQRLMDAGLWGECYDLIEDMADGELSLMDVNDMLWFELDYLLESLGYKEDADGTIRRIEDDE